MFVWSWSLRLCCHILVKCYMVVKPHKFRHYTYCGTQACAGRSSLGTSQSLFLIIIRGECFRSYVTWIKLYHSFRRRVTFITDTLFMIFDYLHRTMLHSYTRWMKICALFVWNGLLWITVNEGLRYLPGNSCQVTGIWITAYEIVRCLGETHLGTILGELCVHFYCSRSVEWKHNKNVSNCKL